MLAAKERDVIGQAGHVSQLAERIEEEGNLNFPMRPGQSVRRCGALGADRPVKKPGP